MTMTIAEELAKEPCLVYRHTVDDYQQMLKTGVIEEGAPFELLDGQIVRKIRNATGQDPMTIGTRHTTAISRLGDLSPRLKKLGCYMRTQSPLTLAPHDEPEPDGMIVRGAIKDYSARHPYASDVLCVIEVADASLSRDRGYKQRLYAKNRIPMYVILNLVNDTVEVRTEPSRDRYSRTTILKARQKLSLPTVKGKSVIVSVRQLLP
jgi:Uma2 family endonuclease